MTETTTPVTLLHLRFRDDADAEKFFTENKHRLRRAGYSHCTETGHRVTMNGRRDIDVMLVSTSLENVGDSDHIDWASSEPAPWWYFDIDMADRTEPTEHEYPSAYGPGTHWSIDAAWEILDTIKPGIISGAVRALLARQISGRLMKEREAREGATEPTELAERLVEAMDGAYWCAPNGEGVAGALHFAVLAATNVLNGMLPADAVTAAIGVRGTYGVKRTYAVVPCPIDFQADIDDLEVHLTYETVEQCEECVRSVISLVAGTKHP